MKMKKIFSIVIIFLICSCSNGIFFIPEQNELPEGQVGSFYFAVIKARYNDGGDFPFLKNNTSIKIEPNNSGLSIKPKFSSAEDHERYDKIIISGVLQKEGEIFISIYSRTYPDMFTPSKSYKKEYKMKVINSRPIDSDKSE
ncbi:hypothetical protein RI820_000913 [Pluralibacter gergoviae]|uniref:hypothetical protein n=1 Tax=Pluralibacter gergoviae TaxID=61647 RepID=UPI0027F2E44A|nr:hypothetical protein [Pluralibacter gergoviae]ELC3016057.1 hypothetical protein [Pluralibacter gergoviae]ELC3021036.1 hypothetical protein [Pluralibacter gergoviae]ELG9929168.1 hypothetical protein [Pluralibacter gergoviae]ELK5593729.1 hypothetical protein [Pluralibacter gergoviae]